MFNKDMVCHYTSHVKAISILKGKQIKFGPLAKCDDPRESKQWNFNLIGNDARLCAENDKEVSNVFNTSIKNNSMLLSFCGWNNEKINFNNNQIAGFRQVYYRAGFARSRMWSHYGDKHTGVCLVFDRKKLEEQFNSTFKTNKKFTGRVQYQYNLGSFVSARTIESRNIFKHGVDKALDMQLDKYFHEYFFLKLMDYRDEHEYRLVVMVDNGDSIGLPIESSLKGVIVGIDFPSHKYKQIDTLAQNCNSSVERYFLSWQEGRPQLWHLCELMK